MNLKIGFDAKRLFRNYTGLGNYSRTLVGNLSRRYGSDRYLLFAERTSDNAEAVDFLSERYEVVQPERGRFLWRAWRMSSDIKSRNVDVFHGLSHDLPLGISRSGAKVVVTIHDVCYRTFPDMFPLVERLIYAWKYRHSCRVADRIIAISESTKADVVRFFGVDPQKIEVIYQAINPVFYHLMPHDEARAVVTHYGVSGDFVLYVGSVNSRKNLLGIIRAYTLLDDDKRLPLVVIGSGSSYLAKCLAEAEKLDVSRYVVVLEGVSSMPTLQAFYRSAKMLVYPSFYEGFGLPVTEALLCECPVVTSSVSSLPEAGGATAFYVDPADAAQIATAMTAVMTLTDTEREQLTQKGRAEALEKFDPDRLTQQVMELYKTLTNNLKTDE